MSIDLTGLSLKQLGALIKNAQKQKTAVAKRAPIAKVRTQLVRLAKKEGYTIEELFGDAAPTTGRKAKPGPKPGRKLGKVAPKYRDPANPENTWTGRGKQPRWMAEQVANGKSPENFLISGKPAKTAKVAKAAKATKTARTARVAKKATRARKSAK